MGAVTNKTIQNQAGQPKMDEDKTTQTTVQAILAHAGQKSDYDSDSNNDQLHINLLLNSE